MILHLDYKFHLEDKTYQARGIDAGETVDEINESMIDEAKTSAICHALDLSVDEIEETTYLNDAVFEYAELY